MIFFLYAIGISPDRDPLYYGGQLCDENGGFMYYSTALPYNGRSKQYNICTKQDCSWNNQLCKQEYYKNNTILLQININMKNKIFEIFRKNEPDQKAIFEKIKIDNRRICFELTALELGFTVIEQKW